MLRAIFIPEFKRSLLQKLLIVVPALLMELLGERMVIAFGFEKTLLRAFGGTTDVVVDSLLWGLIVLSGFLAGGSAFSRINEKHIPFVQALPIPRLEVWTALASVHFITSILMAPVILALRPSLWRQLTAGMLAGSSIFGIAAYLVLFAAGTCFVMLFRNIVVSTTIGGLIVAFSLGIAAIFAWTSEFGWQNDSRVYGIPLPRAGPSPTFWIAACFLLAVLYFGLSLRFFVKGEFNLLRSRLRNWTTVGLVLAGYPLLLSTAIETGMMGNFGGVTRKVVSADGKSLAVIDRFSKQRQEITFLDTETGAITGIYRAYGLIDMTWSKSGSVLNVATLQSPLWRLGYALPPSDSVLRLSPEGKVLGRVRFTFTQIESILAERAGRLLVSGVRNKRAKLLSLDDSENVTELVNTPMKDSTSLGQRQSRYFFLVSSRQNGLERGWSIGEDVQEVPYSPRDKAHAEGEFLFDDGWYSERAAAAEFARRFPLDSELQARGAKDVVASYLAPQLSPVVVPNDRAFAIITNRLSGKRELLAFSKQRGSWRVVGELRTLQRRGTMITPPILRDFDFFGERLSESIVLFQENGMDYLTLYDGKLDRLLKLTGEPPHGVQASYCVRTQRVGPLDGLYMACSPDSFFYRPGGEIMPLSNSSISNRNSLFYIDERGMRIYGDWWSKVVRVNPDGTERQLWPMR